MNKKLNTLCMVSCTMFSTLHGSMLSSAYTYNPHDLRAQQTVAEAQTARRIAAEAQHAQQIQEALTKKQVASLQQEIGQHADQGDFQAIFALQRINPDFFSTAMREGAGNFALKKLLNEFICHEVITDLNSIRMQHKEEIILFFIEHIPTAQFTSINPENGQALVHQFTPWHWHEKIMKTLAAKACLVVQTTKPDRFPGSTLAHNVAALLQRKHSIVNCKWRKDTRTAKGHIFNGRNFLAWWFNRYPLSIALKSNDKNNHTKTCWQLLHPQDRQAILETLTPEAKHLLKIDIDIRHKAKLLSDEEKDDLLKICDFPNHTNHAQ